MKRRIFAFLLSMVMLCSVAFPAFTASAEEIDTVPGTVEETPEPSVEEPVVTPEPPVEPEVTPEPPVEPEVTPEPPVEPEVTPEPPVDECTCSPIANADGTVTHQPGCALYEEPMDNTEEKQCTCGLPDGVHVEGCPLFVAPAPEYTQRTLASQGFKAVGKMPETAVLNVTELRPELNEFIHNQVLGLDELAEGWTAKAYDIKIMDTATGAEFAPTSPVSITMYGTGTTPESQVTVYHLKHTDWQDLDGALEVAKQNPVAAFLDEVFSEEAPEAAFDPASIAVETPAVDSGKDYVFFFTDSFSVFYVLSYTPTETEADEPVDEEEIEPPVEEDPDAETYTLTIQYKMPDEQEAADPYIAVVPAGQPWDLNVISPVVQGYEADEPVVIRHFDSVTAHVTITVTYHPALVDFTVEHYTQNLNDSEYTLVENLTETVSKKKTGEPVGIDLQKTIPGFTALVYDPNIQVAADGSTVVKIYYDRQYFLQSFDLDGGYGTDPVYGPFEAPMGEIAEPTKPGYTFKGWEPAVPDTIPAEDKVYKAVWEAEKQAKVTVVYWGENANDEDYSYISTGEIMADVGSEFTYEGGKLVCTLQEHQHTDSCYTNCFHAHTSNCWQAGGRALMQTTKPAEITGNFVSGTVYFYTTNDGFWGTTTHYYLYLNGNWYCGQNWRGQKSDTDSINQTCDHTHNDSCASCGIQEHSHTNACYLNPGLDASLWRFVSSETVTVAADGSSIVNVYYDRTVFTLTFRNTGSNGTVLGTITDKWGADITARFQEISNAHTFLWSEKSSGNSPWTSYLSAMPAENRTYYKNTSNGYAQKATYYVESLDRPGEYEVYYTTSVVYDGKLTVSEEEFIDIDGFTFNSSKSAKRGDTYNGAKFYYNRNKYTLEFSNCEEIQKSESVYFEANLAPYGNFVPTVPSFYEAGSVEFGGWYLNPECTGEQVILSEHTMPAANMILYAKWQPITHDVKTYLTKDQVGTGTPLDEWTVPHGSLVDPAPDTPVNGEYEFVGWFYEDENGVEKGYDFSMQVRRDMNLYAKWRSNKIVNFTIHYKLKDSDTVIADDFIGSALAGTTKTVNAKGGDDLYAEYRQGYFPETNSHTLLVEIDGNSESTFEYVYKKAVDYTVRYLELNTEKVLHEEKHASTSYAVITEKYAPVVGYMPISFQKHLTLSANEAQNVITFYYIKDDTHAPVVRTHYIQKADGKYEIYQQSPERGVIGQTYDIPLLTIPGYVFNKDHPENLLTGELTINGLELNRYYDVAMYPYEFRFLEEGTNKVLLDPVSDTAQYKSQVSQDALEIPNYTLAEGQPQAQSMIIQMEDGETAVKNVKTFYYVENTAEIKYEVVLDGEVAGGTVSPESENVKVLTGSALGSVPTPDEDFLFDGWYRDAACENPVPEGWVDAETGKITPQKPAGKDVYEAATYYAKFKPALADLTITKSGDVEAEQSFVFHVAGEGIKLDVVIHGSGSVTIKDLPVGNYTVTEEVTWSWRYRPDAASKHVEVRSEGDNSVEFVNSYINDYWLNGCDHETNIFG